MRVRCHPILILQQRQRQQQQLQHQLKQQRQKHQRLLFHDCNDDYRHDALRMILCHITNHHHDHSRHSIRHYHFLRHRAIPLLRNRHAIISCCSTFLLPPTMPSSLSSSLSSSESDKIVQENPTYSLIPLNSSDSIFENSTRQLLLELPV
jgi:hypothetical protein